jgi:polysaccharide biosynthesis transport protein
VVNTIFQQFLRYYKNVRGIRSQESIDTLKSIMDKKKQDLDYKATLLRNRGITDIDPVTTSTYDLISQLQKDLSDERSNKTQKEYELKKIEQRISNLGGGTTTKTDQGNDDLVIAREAMNNAFKAWKSNPSDKSLESRYHQLQQDYNDKVVNSGSTATVDEGPRESLHDLQNKRNDILLDIQASNTKIGGLQSKINNLQGDVNTIASESQSTESLKNEYTQANKDYQDAKNKYGEAIDLNGSALNNFRQVVYGQPAIEPEPSKRMVIVAMGGMAAMVTTMLIIILLTYLDSSIKTPAIFTRSVNLKLISMINFMDLRNKNLADIVANKDGSENVVDRNKFNAFRESIRKLRYEIESSRKKVFLFTSTKKGQGKTTLIQALAYSMSLSKKKILIIDTNFCNNDLTVQLQAEPVLEKIVPFKADASALLEQVRVVSKDVGVGTVYAIGSEGGDYTPSEILPRENLLQHLQSLTTEFDYIFLEGPPLNDFSDSKELAEYVEGVIAVFSAKQIIKQIDKQSISFFKELNGKFCGSILNMVDLENVNVA